MDTTVAPAGFYRSEDCRIEEFIAIVEQETQLADYPLASDVTLGAVVYDAAAVRALLERSPEAQIDLRAEIGRALLSGPGIVSIRGAMEPAVVDRVSDAFFAMIADQKAHNLVAGDHYAKPGANDRLWNAIEKLAVADPEAFVDYYCNDVIALVCSAWLGPTYQISSQVNCINPGGQAQKPHRDYHMGFTTDAVAAQFPAHSHYLSQLLTLQGAVAHCDMPVETGPTMYLPNSQKYGPGFVAWRRPDFIAYFDQHYMQLSLLKGDIVFFNPALFHAGGTNNTTTVRRMANLLQVSSAMGRAMESMDTARMSLAVYPALAARVADGSLTVAAAGRVIDACAEGYAFPTNLDRDQPVARLTPTTQAEVVQQALAERWTVAELAEALAAHAERRVSLLPWE
jgi:ectoine hydroxylase-related dioxygenase (phytanoyl-CoA dioxygenase family)